jgi:hypothetical protein
MAQGCPRPFVLRRHQDFASVAVTGDIAEGAQFTDGTTVLQWRGEDASTGVYDSIETVEHAYCRDGNVTIEWLDPLLGDDQFQQAVTEVLQGRLAEVREHYAAELEQAGHNDAAAFLRQQGGEDRG